MSFPGPVGGAANLACDIGLQRATDQFNFVVDNGGAEPAPTTPSNLQSPAAILPATSGAVGSTTLTLNASLGNNSNITMNGTDSSITINATNTIGVGLTSNTGTVITLDGGGTQSIHFTDPTTTGVAVFQNTANVNTLSIGNDAAGGNVVATFNQATNTTNIGNPLVAGNIYLNNPTNITSSGSRPPVGGLLLQQVNGTASSISQQLATNGILTLGSSTAHPTTLVVSDVPYLGASNFVEINGGAGLAPLFLSGAQGGAQQCGIHPDIGTGGQLLLGSSNTSNNQLQITDTTVQFNVIPNINPSLITTSARIPASGTMTSNTDYYITNPTAVGLYAIVVNVDVTAAGTNNTQVSTIAYWNGTIWDFGGCGRSSLCGGGELIIGFGLFPPSAIRAAISVTFTGATANPAVNVKCIPLYNNLGI